MDATTSTILVIAGLGALGAAIGAVVGTVFGGGRNGMIGLAALFALVGAAGGWWLNQHSIQPGLAYQAAAKSADSSPDVMALKRYYPNDYTTLQRALEAAKDDRKGAAGAMYLVRLQVRDVASRQVRAGADKELVALMAVRRDEAKALQAKSALYCMEFFNGGRFSFDPADIMSADLLKRDAQASADLFTQTATNPVKDAAGAHTDDFTWAGRERAWYEVADRDAVAAKAIAQFPEADRANIRMMTTRKLNLRNQPALAAQLCKYKIALLDEALKLPEPKAAMVYRLNQGTYF